VRDDRESASLGYGLFEFLQSLCLDSRL
jgi:hypothetical protein